MISPKVLNSAFVPTGTMQLMSVLKRCFPHHRLILNDFDQLPAPDLAKGRILNHPKSPTSLVDGPLNSANAPLVASKNGAETIDHDTYLIQDGSVDIYFPTDFSRLKRAYCKYFGKESEQVSIVKSRTFMQEFAELEETKTIFGYNPLVQDYENTTFFLS